MVERCQSVPLMPRATRATKSAVCAPCGGGHIGGGGGARCMSQGVHTHVRRGRGAPWWRARSGRSPRRCPSRRGASGHSWCRRSCGPRHIPSRGRTGRAPAWGRG
eukprot:scaffold112583_cov57-Phaeocystis_antarctica.AAC.2